MIRTIDELVQPMPLQPGQQPKFVGGLGLQNNSGVTDDQLYGWAPDVQILTETDLKKIEK